MIRHTVLYAFRPEASPADITSLFNKLVTLKDLIEGVKAFHWGPYCGPPGKNQGYTYMISVDVTEMSVFKEYSPHPLHNAVREAMAPLLDPQKPLMMFDFEFTAH